MGLLFWLTAAPLVAALVILLAPAGTGAGFRRAVAVLGSLAALVMMVVCWARFDMHSPGYQEVASLHWFTLPSLWLGKDLTVALAFGVDGLSLPLLTLAAVVSLLAAWAGRPKDGRAREYYFWLMMASFGVLWVFTARDLFTFLVALEVALFATFFLIYLFGNGEHRRAAVKFLIYRGLATVALLGAFFGLVYGAVGAFGGLNALINQASSGHNVTFDMQALATAVRHAGTAALPESIRSWLFLALLLAVFIEEAFVPFHTWLPTTNEAAETGTNMLIGGVLTKTGAYVLLRFGVGMLPGEVRHWGWLLAALGALNILYGAFVAWAQSDWRRLIAFGSISHMGLVLLGVGALNAAGLQGAMFMMVSSGLLTALLFHVTGSIQERTGTVRMDRLGGLSRSMPVLSGFLLVAALGSLGLPLTSGFVSEIQAFSGGFGAYPGVSCAAVVGVILSAVYLLYAIQKTTFGPTAEANLGLADARPAEYLPLVVLTGLVLLIGIWPSVIGDVFGLSVQALLRMGG
ncbi:MAG: NADH-quinone oxidoreductase subunit M [Alicyclobacillaceae bacterium]|nr:NADH-quinone oxidoreductase subunit M [Alicyclobacillaceae bacterium]